MKVCRCCKSQIITQKCHNCGFINIAVLDEESEKQEQKLADEYRATIISDNELRQKLVGVLKSVYEDQSCELDYSTMGFDDELLKKAARDGNVEAQIRLGNCYYDGDGVSQNFTLAADWYEKAAKQNNPQGQNCLGICYHYGKGRKIDQKKSVKLFRKASEQGYIKAYNNLGISYKNGEGVPLNYNEAFVLIEKAARAGHAVAQHNLGDLYFNGQGVLKNYTKAVEWYKKAADQGRAWSQQKLADCYYYGYGVEQNYEEALELCKKAEAQGHQITLEWYTQEMKMDLKYEVEGPNMDDLIQGDRLYINREFQKAAKLYKKAAMKGNVIAQTYLGDCYRFGEGVAKDFSKAEEWYKKAALKGYGRAMLSLDVYFGDWLGCYRGINNHDYKITKVAAERCIAEAKNGKIRSQRLIADCYYYGRGIGNKDHVTALNYYTNVEKNGYAVDNEWYLKRKR